MAIKISNLPVQTLNNMSATDVIPITDSETNVTKKVTAGTLIDYLAANGGSGYTGSAGIGYAGSASSLTFGNGIAGYIGSASNPVPSYTGLGPATITVDPSIVVTLTDGQTLTNKIIDYPRILNELVLEGPDVGYFEPFPDVTIASFKANANDYREIAFQNVANGVDSSADFVLYNDASDVNSFFLDIGLNSSLYDSTTYPIFTPNSGYIFTGGGGGGPASQPANLFIGTSTPDSEIIFFTNGVETINSCIVITQYGHLLVGKTVDDMGHIFQVEGDSSVNGNFMPGTDNVHDLGEAAYRWKNFHLTGTVKHQDYWSSGNGGPVTCVAGADTVVATSTISNVRSMKLFVQIEGVEDGDTSGRHTQSCDMIAIRRLSTSNVNTVDSVVYGVIYTSTLPIATLDARWNLTTSLVEITARPTSSTQSVYVKVHATELAMAT